jgi:hypothetical protein
MVLPLSHTHTFLAPVLALAESAGLRDLNDDTLATATCGQPT